MRQTYITLFGHILEYDASVCYCHQHQKLGEQPSSILSDYLSDTNLTNLWASADPDPIELHHRVYKFHLIHKICYTSSLESSSLSPYRLGSSCKIKGISSKMSTFDFSIPLWTGTILRIPLFVKQIRLLFHVKLLILWDLTFFLHFATPSPRFCFVFFTFCRIISCRFTLLLSSATITLTSVLSNYLLFCVIYFHPQPPLPNATIEPVRYFKKLINKQTDGLHWAMGHPT